MPARPMACTHSRRLTPLHLVEPIYQLKATMKSNAGLNYISYFLEFFLNLVLIIKRSY